MRIYGKEKVATAQSGGANMLGIDLNMPVTTEGYLVQVLECSVILTQETEALDETGGVIVGLSNKAYDTAPIGAYVDEAEGIWQSKLVGITSELTRTVYTAGAGDFTTPRPTIQSMIFLTDTDPDVFTGLTRTQSTLIVESLAPITIAMGLFLHWNIRYDQVKATSARLNALMASCC